MSPESLAEQYQVAAAEQMELRTVRAHQLNEHSGEWRSPNWAARPACCDAVPGAEGGANAARPASPVVPPEPASASTARLEDHWERERSHDRLCRAVARFYAVDAHIVRHPPEPRHSPFGSACVPPANVAVAMR